MLGDQWRNNKRKELWKRNTPVHKQVWINFKVWYRAANRETRGMLPFLIIMILVLFVLNFLPLLVASIGPKPPELPHCVSWCFWRV